VSTVLEDSSPTVGIGWYGNAFDDVGTAYVLYT
jgi:hypothetical protein